MVSDTMSSLKEDRAALVIVELFGRVIFSQQICECSLFEASSHLRVTCRVTISFYRANLAHLPTAMGAFAVVRKSSREVASIESATYSVQKSPPDPAVRKSRREWQLRVLGV